MANRGLKIHKNYLNCPACNYDYSKTNILERFDNNGNLSQMVIICECKQKLGLRAMVNGWFKIYDITEIQKRKNEVTKIKRKIKNGTIEAR